MRKFLLCALVAASAMSAAAQPLYTPVKKSQLSEAPKAISRVAAPTTIEASVPAKAYVVSPDRFNAERKQALKRAETELAADYEKPEGALFFGYTADWMGYNVMIMQTHALNDKYIFNNYSSYDEEQPVTFKWTRSGSTSDVEMEQDEDGNAIGYLWGGSLMPTLTVTQGDNSDSFQITTTNSNASTTNAYWYAGMMDQFEVLGNACPGINTTSGYSDIGGYETQTVFYDTDKKAVGIASTFDAPVGAIYTDTLVVCGWFDAPASAKTAADIVGDNILTATIYTFGADGEWIEYAKAECGKDDIIFDPTYGSTGLQFAFVAEDELFGKVSSPITLPMEDFLVTITGFENIETSFISLMTAVGGLGLVGHSYAVLEDGSLATIGYRNYPDVPQSELFIQFHAMEATAVPVTYTDALTQHEIVEIPAEGGYGVTISTSDGAEDYNDYAVYAEQAIENWEIEMSDDDMHDWLAVEYDDDDFESENIITFYFSAEALPEGVEGRGGVVTLSVFGAKIDIPVRQGKFDMDEIVSVKSTRNFVEQKSADAYNLAGQKVGRGFRGLTIKNGKKFMVK